jgi:hypothetical protein
MISQKDEIKIAEQCGMRVEISKSGTLVLIGSEDKHNEFDRLCGVLEEQFEHEAETIRENQ